MLSRLSIFVRRLYQAERLVITKSPTAVSGKPPRGTSHDPSLQFQVVTQQRSTREVLRLVWRRVRDLSRMEAAAGPGSCTYGTLQPPSSVRGMKQLDREAFVFHTHVPCIRVPVKNTNKLLGSASFRKYLLRMPKVKAVAELPEADPDAATHRLVLADPSIFQPEAHARGDETHVQSDALRDETRDALRNCGVEVDAIRPYELTLTYEQWSYEDIFRAVLPEGSIVSGYSQVGHIVHVNLRDELLEYKHIIGQVLLDKVPSARTVVNKVGQIENVFRVFQNEILAGDPDMVVTTREHDVTYTFDFSKVFFNPRLSTEHRRVVESLRLGDVVYDMAAGVGPFAVPAARRGATVLANDLNPDSYTWLLHNAKHNKARVPMRAFNMDGRDFIREVARKDLLERWRGTHADYTDDSHPLPQGYYFLMNLPDLALEFLDVFPGLLQGVSPSVEEFPHFQLPRVFCYCFMAGVDPASRARSKAEQILGTTLGDNAVVRFVRNVAPNKDMLCVNFTLKRETLFGTATEVKPSQPEVDPKQPEVDPRQPETDPKQPETDPKQSEVETRTSTAKREGDKDLQPPEKKAKAQ